MAHIVIDGYNLLPVTPFSKREKLISVLAAYRRERGHDITVVFDGTHGGAGTGGRSYETGVEVIFSPLTFTADDIIEKMLPDLDPNVTIVVSSDRRIQSAARRSGAVFVSSQEFAPRLSLSRSSEYESATPPWLEGRADDEDHPRKKKGSSKKLSKEARRKQRSMKKL